MVCNGAAAAAALAGVVVGAAVADAVAEVVAEGLTEALAVGEAGVLSLDLRATPTRTVVRTASPTRPAADTRGEMLNRPASSGVRARRAPR